MSHYIRSELEIDGVPARPAWAYDGSYIGDWGLDPEFFAYLDEHDIRPQKRRSKNDVATIGYSAHEHRWYGWSHRGIGSFVTRKEAADFAESVS